jgi:hypothetical protein
VAFKSGSSVRGVVSWTPRMILSSDNTVLYKALIKSFHARCRVDGLRFIRQGLPGFAVGAKEKSPKYVWRGEVVERRGPVSGRTSVRDTSVKLGARTTTEAQCGAIHVRASGMRNRLPVRLLGALSLSLEKKLRHHIPRHPHLHPFTPLPLPIFVSSLPDLSFTCREEPRAT